MEYLSDWPFQGTFLETPYGNLIGRELEVPTVQGTITGLPLSCRGYRRDTDASSSPLSPLTSDYPISVFLMQYRGLPINVRLSFTLI